MPAPGQIDAAQAQTLQAAFGALQRGDLAAAHAAVQSVLAVSPGAPDALHLLALVRRRAGDLPGAALAFEATLARKPDDPQILANYAVTLARLGRLDDAIARYREALERDPKAGQTWMNLGLAELRRGDAAAAEAAMLRATELSPRSAPAWQGLGAARRDLGDGEGAETALRRAIEIAPDLGAAWTALGMVRRAAGDPEDALACYERARAGGYAALELDDAEAGARVDLGDVEGAIARVRALIQRAPDYTQAHITLAHLLWEHGAGDPLQGFRDAIAARPDDTALRAAFVNTLVEAERYQDAIGEVTPLRARSDNSALAVAHAEALHLAGEPNAAASVLTDALARMPHDARFLCAAARQMLRVGRPDEAAALALEATKLNVNDQEAYALLGVAWRLLNDPREDWLCAYDRFVMRGAIEPPPGYADTAAFMAALTETLTAMHVMQRAPLQQSLREGSQTQGNLFGRRDPIIAAARDALLATARRLIAALPKDAEHPFLRRNTGDVRAIGSWSVRLRSSGRHINHFHPEGWLSSAFYVSLPPSVTREGSAQGRIQFGQPPLDYGLDLAPRRVEAPEVGTLVLFPSYLWHGTTPFEDEAPRLTIAFDALPR